MEKAFFELLEDMPRKDQTLLLGLLNATIKQVATSLEKAAAISDSFPKQIERVGEQMNLKILLILKSAYVAGKEQKINELKMKN